MTYSIVTQPAAGTLGTVDQVKDLPPAGCVGVTSLAYPATDPTGAALTATVSVGVG